MRIQTYAEFWPYYLSQHLDRTCRALHFVGTTLVLACLALSAVSPWTLAVAPVLGYGPAWVGHFVYERNRPATFSHPLWSLISDFRMWGLMVGGRLGQELERSASASR